MGLAGAAELVVCRGAFVRQGVLFQIAERPVAVFAQLINGLMAGDVDHPGQRRREMRFVARSVVPDAHEAFLQHFFGEIAAPHKPQGDTVQAWADAAVQRFEGAPVTQ